MWYKSILRNMVRKPILMRSQGKPGKMDNLKLKWDKKEQLYIDQLKLNKRKPFVKRNVEEYLEFLSEIPPTSAESLKSRATDKQFTLV